MMIDFDELPIKVAGTWVGSFAGSAEVRIDSVGDAYIGPITVTALVRGDDDISLQPPTPGDFTTIAQADAVILWAWLEAAIRERYDDELMQYECDAAIADLGYGPMQHERH